MMIRTDNNPVTFEVLAAVTVKMAVFWDESSKLHG
jgi:hypothetical protein